jgi:phosphoglycerate dehydrogenase-like enzyme
MENVVVTPHISGLSVAYQDRAMQILEINLENLEKGRPLLNLVDKRKGY